MRSVDRWSFAILTVGIAQLVLGAVLLSFQNPPASIQDFVDGNQSARIQALESLRIPERLAVLERIAEDGDTTRRLLYGVMAAVVASLITQGLQIKSQRSRRSE